LKPRLAGYRPQSLPLQAETSAYLGGEPPQGGLVAERL